MAIVNTYLLFDGNCEEAFTLYKSAFGGDFASLVRYGNVPPMEGMPPIEETDKNKIENISLPISKETIIMGGDVIGYMKQNTIFGNNFSIYIEAENKEEVYKIFDTLSDGGNIIMPLNQAHWGDYFGMLTDKFGVKWLINYALNKA